MFYYCISPEGSDDLLPVLQTNTSSKNSESLAQSHLGNQGERGEGRNKFQITKGLYVLSQSTTIQQTFTVNYEKDWNRMVEKAQVVVRGFESRFLH